MNRLRLARPEEAEDILAFYQSLIDTPGCTWNMDYPYLEVVQEDIALFSLYCLTDEEGRLLAAATARIDHDIDLLPCWDKTRRNWCELERVGVSRELQGRGIGKELLWQVLSDVQARGFDSVRMLVSRQNQAALALYRSLGFVRCGETRMYDQDWDCQELLLPLAVLPETALRTTLENDQLLITVAQRGAELSRIRDKRQNREILWHADPAAWGSHAPLLFPFVGNCRDAKYRYNGREYPMGIHGFARNLDFSLLSASSEEVWYQLSDTSYTYEVYPFHFSLKIGHRLEGDSVRVMWQVHNTDEKELWFMIGGHPAFRPPEGKTIYDFTLEFPGKCTLHYQHPVAGGVIDPDGGQLLLNQGKVPIVPGFFQSAPTYIFDRGQVETVSLLVDDVPYLSLHCPGFPYLGIWTKEATNPFLCLEPWFGRGVSVGFSGELAQRDGINRLSPGGIFEQEYLIQIHSSYPVHQ